MRLRWIMLAIILLGLGVLFRPQERWTSLQISWVLVTQHDDGVSVLCLITRRTGRSNRLASPSYDELAEEMQLAYIKNDGTTNIATIAGPTMSLMHPNYSAVIPREDGIYTFDSFTGDHLPHIYRIRYAATKAGRIVVEKFGEDPELLSHVKEWAGVAESSQTPARTDNVLFFDSGLDSVISTTSAMRIGMRYNDNIATLFAEGTGEQSPFEVVLSEIDVSRHPYP